MPFGIAYLAKLAFDPPSTYTVPQAFVAAPPSLLAGLQVVFTVPPSFGTALPSKGVIVVIHPLWSSTRSWFALVQIAAMRQSMECNTSVLHLLE